MPASVLVTGAFGNIGRRAIQHLLAAGHRVLALDLKTPRSAAAAERFGPALQVLWGDICDAGVWTRALSGVDTVVHLAAIIPPAADRNPARTIAVNQTATFDLLERMAASPGARRLIFASSMVVAGYEQHGRTPPLRADEEPRPADLYGKTKVECERRIRSSPLDWSILRLAVCTSGELSFAQTGSLELMFEASASGRVEVVHNDDAALAFANAVVCDEAIGKILFIGGGERCRSHALDFYNGLLGAVGLGPLKPESLRPGPAYFWGDWLDTTESERLLNFQRHSLESIYAEMRANVGLKRWPLRVLAPLVNSLLERRSPHRRRLPSGRRASGR